MDSSQVPADFRCPISLDTMSDPVILPSGHTFDRSSIQHWLDSGHRTCPISNLPLPPHPNLIPNHGLRSLISSFFESSTSVASTSLVANRLVRNPPPSKFAWTIRNFSKLSVKKLYSELFLVGGCKWRILIYPKGNNVDHLSLYLDVAESAQLLHKRRSMHVQFSFGVVDEVKMVSIRKGTQHRFNARENDWGFTSFMPLSDLCDPNRGYVVNDTLVVEAEVAVQWVSHWTYDSKTRTGYVGLKNHGETGYMNTLLQTLYHIPYL